MAQFYTSPYGTRINVTGLSGKPLATVQRLANNAHGLRASQVARNQRKLLIPKVTNTPTVSNPDPNPNPDTLHTLPALINTNTSLPNATPAAPSNPNNANTLFPTERIFEPQNYQGSPLYQFQVKAGEDQLAKSLAAKGLTKSGEAIRQELNIPMYAAAQDTQRMTDLATQNADRLNQIQQFNATRQDNAGNTAWNRMYDIASLMAQQSPWDAAIGGLNNTATTTGNAANSLANYLANAYQRVSGGGGPTAQPLPLPTGPNYINTLPANIAAGASNSNGWLDIANNLISNLFPSNQQTKQAK